ncbi:hypothetical protein BDR26DRAFT_529717 [Obelidium mucronatum]|nr:hypothetical protein BDR26DRAFT_529717 [Obelidium mucronatum]
MEYLQEQEQLDDTFPANMYMPLHLQAIPQPNEQPQQVAAQHQPINLPYDPPFSPQQQQEMSNSHIPLPLQATPQHQNEQTEDAANIPQYPLSQMQNPEQHGSSNWHQVMHESQQPQLTSPSSSHMPQSSGYQSYHVPTASGSSSSQPYGIVLRTRPVISRQNQASSSLSQNYQDTKGKVESKSRIRKGQGPAASRKQMPKSQAANRKEKGKAQPAAKGSTSSQNGNQRLQAMWENAREHARSLKAHAAAAKRGAAAANRSAAAAANREAEAARLADAAQIAAEDMEAFMYDNWDDAADNNDAENDDSDNDDDADDSDGDRDDADTGDENYK